MRGNAGEGGIRCGRPKVVLNRMQWGSGIMGWQTSPLSTEQIEDRVARLPETLRPVRDAVLAVASSGAWIEGGTGGPVLAGSRPDVGSEVYDIVIFPPLSAEHLETYQRLHDFTLPEAVLRFLRHVNGAVLFEIKLYGVPPSMAVDPPQLDRSRRAPLDIASGRYWRHAYAGADPADVLIGSRNVGGAGQIGYFTDPQGRISGRGNGSTEAPMACGPWANLTEWLAAEMAEIRFAG